MSETNYQEGHERVGQARPVAWRYRYVKKGITDFQGKQWVGDWKYVPTEEDCNDRSNYEIQALFTAPPASVTSEGLVKAVRFYEQVRCEGPPVEVRAWRDAIDWVLKEARLVVNTGIRGGRMGVTASYTMHLYYNCHQCADGKYQSPDFGEYISTSQTNCAKEARKDGWRISTDKTRAFAPGHKILRSNKGE